MAIHNPTPVYMAIHNPTQVNMAIHNPTQVYMAIHYPTQVYMALHNPTQVYIALHNPTQEMADENQTGLMQKIDQLCIKYDSSFMTLNVNNEKLFTSHIKHNQEP